jgi:hypothetical protein
MHRIAMLEMSSSLRNRSNVDFRHYEPRGCGMNRTSAICAAVVAAAVVATAAAAATPRVIGSASAGGDYAIANASGTAKHPHQVYVRVLAKPAQAVRGAWTLVCSKGFGAGTKSGTVTGRAPFTKPLKLPMKNSDQCIVSANAQLSRSGTVTVQILAR